jgi:hypothetical protein
MFNQNIKTSGTLNKDFENIDDKFLYGPDYLDEEFNFTNFLNNYDLIVVKESRKNTF